MSYRPVHQQRGRSGGRGEGKGRREDEDEEDLASRGWRYATRLLATIVVAYRGLLSPSLEEGEERVDEHDDRFISLRSRGEISEEEREPTDRFPCGSDLRVSARKG